MQLVKQAGLVLTDVKAVQAVLDRGEHRRILEWTIAEAGPALVKTGLLTPAELDRALHDMQQAAADDAIVVFMPRMLQVIATRP